MPTNLVLLKLQSKHVRASSTLSPKPMLAPDIWMCPQSPLKKCTFVFRSLPFPSFAPPGESLPLAVLEPPEKLMAKATWGSTIPVIGGPKSQTVLKSSPQTAAREGGRVLKVLGPGANYGRIASMVRSSPSLLLHLQAKVFHWPCSSLRKSLWPKPPGEVPSQSSEGPKTRPY